MRLTALTYPPNTVFQCNTKRQFRLYSGVGEGEKSEGKIKERGTTCLRFSEFLCLHMGLRTVRCGTPQKAHEPPFRENGGIQPFRVAPALSKLARTP